MDSEKTPHTRDGDVLNSGSSCGGNAIGIGCSADDITIPSKASYSYNDKLLILQGASNEVKSSTLHDWQNKDRLFIAAAVKLGFGDLKLLVSICSHSMIYGMLVHSSHILFFIFFIYFTEG